MSQLTESLIESATLEWLEAVGWSVRHGGEMVPGELFGECLSSGYIARQFAHGLLQAGVRRLVALPGATMESE